MEEADWVISVITAGVDYLFSYEEVSPQPLFEIPSNNRDISTCCQEGVTFPFQLEFANKLVGLISVLLFLVLRSILLSYLLI